MQTARYACSVPKIRVISVTGGLPSGFCARPWLDSSISGRFPFAHLDMLGGMADRWGQAGGLRSCHGVVTTMEQHAGMGWHALTPRPQQNVRACGLSAAPVGVSFVTALSQLCGNWGS
jgi:hypothetical protein